MNLKEWASVNLDNLKNNTYPGRGIIIGMTPDKSNIVQIYWIMGRSKNSRNRIFRLEGETVRTEAFNTSEMEDPSLIIYNCISQYKNHHVVANGDQSDTVIAYLKQGKTFKEALDTREYEPDDPNCTPRITGEVNLDTMGYTLSILKSVHNLKGMHSKNFFDYPQFLNGYGHLIHTYKENGDPLPSFSGDPKIVEIQNDLSDNLDFYWNLVNETYKVSMLVKYINVETGETKTVVKNKLSH